MGILVFTPRTFVKRQNGRSGICASGADVASMAMHTRSRSTLLVRLPWIDSAPPRWLLVVVAIPGFLVGAAVGSSTAAVAGLAGVPGATVLGVLALALTLASVLLAAALGWSLGAP